VPCPDLYPICDRPVLGPFVFTAIGYQCVKIEKQQQTVIACFAARGSKVWDDAPAIVRSAPR
jgi:hypothetical protein